jgi:integrase
MNEPTDDHSATKRTEPEEIPVPAELGGGSVTILSYNGRCRAVLPARLFRDGKRHAITADSPEDLQGKAGQLFEDLKNKLDSVKARSKLSDFLQEWLDFRKTSGIEERTWNGYREHVERYIDPHLGNVALGALTARHIDEWRQTLRERGGHKGRRLITVPTTVAGVLRMALDQAVRWRYLAENPAATKYVTRMRKVRTNAVRQVPEPKGLLKLALAMEDDPYGALFRLEIDSGMRPGEVYALCIADLDLDNDALTVTQALKETRRKKGEKGPARVVGAPKNRPSVRRIDLSPDTVKALRNSYRGGSN